MCMAYNGHACGVKAGFSNFLSVGGSTSNYCTLITKANEYIEEAPR
jgi:hypothetical protein